MGIIRASGNNCGRHRHRDPHGAFDGETPSAMAIGLLDPVMERAMKWSLKVGQVAGTGIYVHVTFFVLLFWIGVIDGLEQRSLAAAVEAVGFTMTLFTCVVLHEFGHAFMARRFGIRTRDIILLPIGGVGRLERIPEVPAQELLIALGGPAVSVAIAAALFAALWLQGSAPPLEAFTTGNAPLAGQLMVLNAGLAVFNLLPAFPMDGGRVLRALLAMRFDYADATEVAARIGQAIAAVFALAGVLLPNLILVIIALFVWMGAAGEVGVARVKRALRGATVDAVMRTEFGTLAPHDTVRHAAEMALRRAQSDFPVLAGGRVVGLLSRHDLTRGLAADEHRSAGELMHRTFETVDGSEPLDAVFGRLSQAPDQTLLVMDHERLVGLVSLDEIINLLRLRRGVARRQSTGMAEDLPTDRRTGTPEQAGSTPWLPTHTSHDIS